MQLRAHAPGVSSLFRLEGPCRSSWRRRARTACVGSSSFRSRHRTRHGQPSRPPRSRPSTVSATRASSCPTRQRTSGRAMISAARSACLSCRPMEPACVNGVRAAVWLARRAQAAAVASERVGRRDPSAPRGGAPAARPAGGAGANARGKTRASEGRLHNVVTRVLTRYARSHHIGWHCNVCWGAPGGFDL